MSGKDATMSAKDATRSAKAATKGAKDATMSGKNATMSAKDATRTAKAATSAADAGRVAAFLRYVIAHNKYSQAPHPATFRKPPPSLVSRFQHKYPDYHLWEKNVCAVAGRFFTGGYERLESSFFLSGAIQRTPSEKSP